MGSWMKVKLAQVCSSISDGDHLPPPKCESGIPFVTISDIKNNKFDLSNTRFVPKTYFDTIDEKRRIRKGDVLYSVVGSYGIPVYADKDLEVAFQRHIAILKPSDTVDSRFLYFSMLNSAFYNAADNVAIGAAQKTITLAALRNLQIPLPPLPVQRRIADILSVYDDLIENNRRRIAILEETARLAYRKWFGGVMESDGGMRRETIDDQGLGVRHETIDDPHVSSLASKTARVTRLTSHAQSRAATLGEIADVVMGQSPESKAYNDNGEGLPFHQGVTGFGFRYPRNEMWCTAGTRFAEEGDILFSVRAPVGRINVAGERIVIGRGLSAMRAKNGFQSWLLYALKHHFSKEDMIGVGCIFASTTKKELLSVELPFPSDEEIAAFEQIAGPIDAQIKALSKQNAALATARDMLLPRLMKGELIP